MGMKDKAKWSATGASGEIAPKSVSKADMTGEKKTPLKGGVGLGEKDRVGGANGTGRDGMGEHERGEMNTGRSESVCYEHKRIPHDQDSNG